MEAALHRARREALLRNVVAYVLVNSVLAAVDFMSGEGWWVQWVLLGWGLGLLMQAWRLRAHRPPKK
jgi:hypothetical protein